MGDATVCAILAHIRNTDRVGATFGSHANVEFLNDAIQRGVFSASDGRWKIGRQSQLELATIMRSVYITHSRHLPGAIADQVRALNDAVLAYAVPQIVSEADMHAYYLADRDQERRGIAPRSQLVSGAGQRSEVQAPARPFIVPDAV